MKKIFSYPTFGWLLFIIGFSTAPVAAQTPIKLIVDSQLRAPSTSALPADRRAELIKTVEAAINEYAAAGTMMDASRKKVTSESVKRFQALFTPSAEIAKDFSEKNFDELMNYKDYSGTIYNQMTTQGLELRVNSARLVEIQNDESGYFIPIVIVEKQIFNFVTSKGEVRKTNSGRLFVHEFRFDVNKDNLSKARIAKIKRHCKDPRDCGVRADYVQYGGLFSGASWYLNNVKYTDAWENNHSANSQLDIKRDLGLSVGYEMLTNRLSKADAFKKNLFLSVGARFNLHLVEVELTDFSIQDFIATTVGTTDDGNYLRSGNTISSVEKFRVGLLEVPLGLGFRLKSSESKAWFAHLRLIPGLAIIGGKGTASGQGDYFAALNQYNWYSGNPKAYNPNDPDFDIFQIGLREEINEEPEVKKAGLTMAVQVSPTGYFDLSKGDKVKTLSLGLDITFNLNSIVGHEEREDDLLRYTSGDYPIGLLQQYLSGMTAFSVGLRVGFHRKTTSKP